MPVEATGKKLPEIEALRGIAVSAVILFHAHGNLVVAPHRLLDAFSARLSYWTGVDLFFAISGFVIARSLLPTLAACTTQRERITTILAFWLRRAWRLLPSAWFWLFVLLAASVWFNRSGVFMPPGANAWATAAGILDFANFRHAVTFMRSPYGASFPWWSLSLEEQFYFVFPLLAWALGNYIWAPALLGVILQFHLFRNPLLMFIRTDAILWGVLLAIIWHHPYRARFSQLLAALPRVITAALALGLLLCLGALGQEALLFWPYRMASIAIVSACLVFLAASDCGLILADNLPRRLLIWLGARSYAFYLIHIPAFLAAREIFFRLPPQPTEIPVTLTGFALLVVLAELNWRILENPLRHHGARAAARFLARRAQHPIPMPEAAHA